MRKAYSYIRMSTETQLKGDSLRRQLEGSERYAKDNDLELVNSIDGTPLKDLGVSAFNGKNTQKGAFSLFLSALNDGKIEPNSVLLIESLDRLSRDKILEALPQFLNIVNGGIEIVTLADNQVYNKEIIGNNPNSLFVSLGVMLRANEESETKSKRIRAAWANKRKKTDKKILTRICPAWLRYSEEKECFEFEPDRAQVVKRIFDMCINSGGLYSIARYLNENHVPVFGNGKIWYRSYISKIITNRSVMGELQPHEMLNGKRQKIGEPILDYFPKLIDEQQFLLAQSAISRRTKNGKGRKGSNFSNLFMGITYCGNCNFKMSLRNHGGTERYSKCLVCINKNHKGGCETGEWNLADFESIIFPHLREINFEELVGENAKKSDISLNNQIEILKRKLEIKENEIERAMDSLVSDDLICEVKGRFRGRVNGLQVEIDQIKLNIGEVQNKISEETFLKNNENPSKLKELLGKIELHKDDYVFRSSVNQMLLRMIERVELVEPNEQLLPWELNEESYEVQSFRKTSEIRMNRTLDQILESNDFSNFYKKCQRLITIKYRSGSVRHILWGRNVSFGPNV